METAKMFSLFNSSGRIEELKDSSLKVGQIIWLNGYGQNPRDHERLAIYAIRESKWGTYYDCINLDNPCRKSEDARCIRHVSRLFGIGMYYNDNDLATSEEIVDALSVANEKERKAKEATDVFEKERSGMIEKGRKIFEENKPEGSVCVIVAQLKKDESDPMTDYFNSSTSKEIILAFSMHKRDLFSEMRKAALNCDIEDVRSLADAPKEYENREKWSMGAGYYLGKSKYSGWIICKGWIGRSADELYEIAGRGGFHAWKR
jgi:hypothetical protein